MGKPFAVESLQHGVSAAVAEEHDCLACRLPPNNRVCCSYENPLRQDLRRRRLAEIIHQVREHLGCNEMASPKACRFPFMNHFVQSHERMPVGKTVIAALPVDQQNPAEPEFLAGADADAGVHRQSPESSQRSSPLWPSTGASRRRTQGSL